MGVRALMLSRPHLIARACNVVVRGCDVIKHIPLHTQALGQHGKFLKYVYFVPTNAIIIIRNANVSVS